MLRVNESVTGLKHRKRSEDVKIDTKHNEKAKNTTMTQTTHVPNTKLVEPVAALLKFRAALAEARNAAEAWKALHALSDDLVSAKLFTVTTVDVDRGEARRLYTSDPVHYAVSGTKPVTVDDWYDLVVVRQQNFVANTIEEIAVHFFDHELIGSLGLGSCINLPVVLGGKVIATVNVLDAAHHFMPERVARAEHLVLPALACWLIERQEAGG